MDMDYFVDLGGEASAASVDLNAAPETAEQYLRQVQLDRKRHAEVVVAAVDTSQFPVPATTLFHPHPPPPKKTRTPPQSWRQAQVENFLQLRENLVTVKAKLKKEGSLLKINFPHTEDEAGWRSFCLGRWSRQMDKEEMRRWEGNKDPEALEKALEAHQGTPPLLRLVLSMNQGEVVDLLGFAVEWLGEDGYSKPLFHWTHALLAVLEKPLEPETCASLRFPPSLFHWTHALLAVLEKPLEPETCVSLRWPALMNCPSHEGNGAGLRDLARYCGQGRSAEEGGEERGREFSFFITVVAGVFDQADLADKDPE